ncbi:MAG TPA: DUF1028 domain-containing protein [Stellaceae bacterium]|nr:DUF1028 domain-containing protein [Stellaceae bacterium]
MTFSISARCPTTGMFGIAISSSSPAVAARCAHARAGVGVVATQNITDPSLGPGGLDLMERGASASQARDILVATRRHIDHRQLALVDSLGRTAIFSGARTLGVNAVAEGPGVAAAGNLLATEEVPWKMVDAFGASSGHLGDRLLVAMQAALAAGGEAGPVHSAGLLLVRDVAWPVADLRVDWDEHDPIAALHRLWDIYRPQLEAYVDRALDPTAAPRYGVPGDE